ncbi:hypothetical protein LCL99_03560 [Halomonas denitrificans]|uniref:hypothetical protein n=1 Tax=Halomonas TaxID=2745 RepID=UPI001A8C7AE9|nr:MULTISPECIES: hypothetical protein [Halomonas]MED5296642.1 hypothetical protein [Pseudomonadota bacterium]MBN8411368.1 hypothetical protein [Halomonas litopenaei]MBY5925986.1 hypothetical protein [Halomonas sp. DP4Y7-2]MBY5927717.1 hypothetical protein [Halomonas sp. DP8Y7-3]MBY5969804.1 hypothetical protein [Halomonas denitrificans]
MASSEIQKTRVINELTGFIKKLLQDPKILETSLEIARRHLEKGSDSGVMADIANEISDTTSIHIPDSADEHSEADRLFLELLKEVVQEEKALY